MPTKKQILWLIPGLAVGCLWWLLVWRIVCWMLGM